MTSGRILVASSLAIAATALAWLMFVGLPRWYVAPATTRASAAPSTTAPLPPGRKIKARLYYVGDDGMRLVAVEREVLFGEGTVDQAREIINMQIAPVAEPLVSAIPPGTKLRALFVSERGEAYVDLSREVSSAHEGGVLNELLTVYTIVNTLTANLPAVTAVQVLVDGKEVETLAGHVDLRRPLAGNLAWIQ
jgi:hypothetical protein